jgi:hypothetical protein
MPSFFTYSWLPASSAPQCSVRLECKHKPKDWREQSQHHQDAENVDWVTLVLVTCRKVGDFSIIFQIKIIKIKIIITPNRREETQYSFSVFFIYLQQ